MSHRRPRRPRRASSSSSISLRSTHSIATIIYQYITPSDVPCERRFSRHVYLPRPRGELHIHGQAFSQQSSATHSQVDLPQTNPLPSVDLEADDDPFTALADIDVADTPYAQVRHSVSSRKKERQWEKWTTTVIPSLIPVFLDLQHRSQSL